MAGILIAMLLLGGGVAIINEQAKTRKTTKEPKLKVPKLKDLENFLKKSKFFKVEDMPKLLKIADDIKKRRKPTPSVTVEPDIDYILNKKPEAWCPSENDNTCFLHVRDKNFPMNCVGDISKDHCLRRIGKYIANENNKKVQLEEYCQRVNDVCVEYRNPDFATKQDCTKCDTLIPKCNC